MRACAPRCRPSLSPLAVAPRCRPSLSPLADPHEPWSAIPHSPPSAPSPSPHAPVRLGAAPIPPQCPPVLDYAMSRLSSRSGIVTIVCDHTFHCECLRRWADSSCPVCRHVSDDSQVRLLQSLSSPRHADASHCPARLSCIHLAVPAACLVGIHARCPRALSHGALASRTRCL